MLHDVPSSAPGRSDRLLTHPRRAQTFILRPVILPPIALPLGGHIALGALEVALSAGHGRAPEAAGLNAKAMLADTNPGTVFKATCSMTGLMLTNVNDFRVILIEER